ncbi:2OG-Fe(II) oxygenase [Idiomarina seosinensis]|uniref:Proline hydroxylase n=1 Tax=Idiomarina seosinensis TaxID=281739 RepID=A0A432ZG77_9GAMM|nr:2OG-Fe(II) oxygenase [Idiomarina seosinensis]RUO76976.1 proline hydroxylase [Idiomarina seosinensis]
MNDFIETYDNALSKQQCQTLIDTFEQSPHTGPGRTGGGVDKTKKISTDLYLNSHREYQSLLQQIQQATARCAVEYFKKYRFALIAPVSLTLKHPQTGQPVMLTDDNFDELAAGNEMLLMQKLFRLGAIQMQKYDKAEGNYNYWHCEQFPQKGSTEALHRALLFMVYLNDVEEGGETDFYYQQRSLRPTAGQLVIAPAYFTHTHRGRMPISNDKYILTSWILHNRGEQLYG